MTAKRNLLAVACAGVLCGAAAAQTPLFGGRPSAPSSYSTRPVVPSAGGTTSGSILPDLPPPGGSMLPPAQPTQAAPPLYPTTETVATDVLTSPQGGVPMAHGGAYGPAIPGAAYSPWCGDSPAGVGGNGPVTYEGYVRTGPSLNIGGGELSAILDHGWMTAIGGRSLFFNETNDAAWVLDLGFSFTQNRGPRLARITQMDADSLKDGEGNNFTIPVGIRAIRRTSLNFGIGRDWWLYGPGTVEANGGSGFGNWRGGVDVGGRWGTSSIDVEPQFDAGGVRRRQAVYHGVYVGSSLNWEKQFGGVILLAGIRGEWGYDWTNLLPPQTSNLQNLNVLMTFGLRY